MNTHIMQPRHFRFTLFDKIMMLLDVVNDWIQRHHQRRQLAQLDARLLRDMGLSTEQVRLEISKPFWK